MVAYSFKARFENPIIAGWKMQTVRADRKRHARPGEELQLYTGMRTKHCRLIGRAECLSVLPVTIHFDDADDEAEGFTLLDRFNTATRDTFARRDGFENWQDFKAFWRENHPGIDTFSGVLITWGVLR